MKTVYRVVTAIICISVIPITIFLPMFRVAVSSSLSSNLMSTIGLPEYISIKDIIVLVKDSADNQTASALLKALKEGLLNSDSSDVLSGFTNLKIIYAFLAFFILMLVLVLVTAGFAIFSKKSGVTTCLTAGSIVAAFAMNKSFNMFAEPLLSGELGLKSLLSGLDSSLTSILSSLAKVSYLQLSFFYPATLLVLFIALIFGISVVFEERYGK